MNTFEIMRQAHLLESSTRYEAVVREIETYDNPRVLEVGPAESGILPFLRSPAQMAYTDILEDFGGETKVPKFRSSADALPFASTTFEVVAALDVMEHLPQPIRAKAVSEMYRLVVPGGKLVISSPIGEDAAKADGWLSQQLEQAGIDPHRWVAEHIEHGIPSESDYDRWITELDPVPPVRILADLSVAAWKHSLETTTLPQNSKLARATHLARFALLQRLPRTLSSSPVYRQVYVIEKPTDIALTQQ